jgi:hypothetical protein
VPFIEKLDERSEVVAALAMVEDPDPVAVTGGEGEPVLPAELTHALSELERMAEIENAEWNHLHEGQDAPLDEGWPLA